MVVVFCRWHNIKTRGWFNQVFEQILAVYSEEGTTRDKEGPHDLDTVGRAMITKLSLISKILRCPYCSGFNGNLTQYLPRDVSVKGAKDEGNAAHR